MGEVVLSAIEPAIANAIYDAVGVRLSSQPLSRERIWKALQKKKVSEREKVAMA